jgi:hypothetical protein
LWEEIENLRCAKRDLEGEVSNLKEQKVENDEKVKTITIFVIGSVFQFQIKLYQDSIGSVQRLSTMLKNNTEKRGEGSNEESENNSAADSVEPEELLKKVGKHFFCTENYFPALFVNL